MSVLNEIKTLLDANGTLGTLTLGFMPPSPDAIGTLYEYGGQVMERRFGVTGVGYEKPSVQIVFRGVPWDYSGPRAKALAALNILAGVQPGTLSAIVYLKIDPQQAPFPVQPMDANNRHLIGFNAYATKEPS